jgi:penicillin-binding protein 1A
VKSLSDIEPWRLAVVLEANDQSARVGLQPARDPGGAVAKDREVGIVPLEGVKWAKAASGPAKAIQRVTQVLSPGDVVYVEPVSKEKGEYRLRQVPEISGAMVVMDPQTGRVLAMVRVLLRPEPVQSRHPGAAATWLILQAAGLCRCHRQRLHAVERGP